MTEPLIPETAIGDKKELTEINVWDERSIPRISEAASSRIWKIGVNQVE